MARRDSPVPDWIPGDLPAAPGVYRFLDPAGTPIYIGKSVNLKRRVRSYFYGGGPDDERKREMLRLARDLAWRRCGSDLEAQLEEADGIAALRPAFNRVHKNRSRGWYIEVDWSRPFPRLRVVREPRRARAEYIGPYRGRRIPSDAVALVEKIYRLRTCAGAIRPDENGSPCLQHGIDQCNAPCVGLIDVDTYRAHVRRAVAALVDDRQAERDARIVRQRLKRAEETAAASGSGSSDRSRSASGSTSGATTAGASALLPLKRRLVWFEELASFRPALRRLPVDRSRLIVLPGVEADERVLVPIARGRVLERSSIDVGGDGWTDEVEDACYRVRVAELRAESAFPVEALTLTLIVNRWLGKRRARRQNSGSGEDRRGGVGRGDPGGGGDEADARRDHVFDLDAVDAPVIIDRLRRRMPRMAAG